MSDDASLLLRGRSVRTLAWLGDAAYEREVRVRLALRGDYPTERLDAIKSSIVCAEAQAKMVADIDDDLNPEERDWIRRGRNTALPSSARGRRNTREYREATGFEVLVGHWLLGDRAARARFEAVVVPRLEAEIERGLAEHGTKPRRG